MHQCNNVTASLPDWYFSTSKSFWRKYIKSFWRKYIKIDFLKCSSWWKIVSFFKIKMLHSKELHPLSMWLVPLSYSRSPSYGFILKDLMCIKAQGNIICCFRQSSLFYRTTHSQTSARVSLWHRMSSLYPSQWQNVFLFCFFFSTYLTVAWCLAQSRLGTKVSWGKGIAVKDIKQPWLFTIER